MLNLEKIIGILVSFIFLTSAVPAQDDARFYREKPALGTIVSITCYPDDSIQAKLATGKAFNLLDSFNLIFSDYDPTSEVLRLSKNYLPGQAVDVSLPLYDLTRKASEIRDLTLGSFNIAIGSLTHLWRSYLKDNRVPPLGKIRRYRNLLSPEMLLTDQPGKIEFAKKSMRLDFGGIAKGYIGDHMALVLRKHGISRFLIDLGGDLVAGDPPPNQSAWKITITWCRKSVQIANESIATSGPDFQFFVHKGKRYAHIIDPNTGWGVRNFFGTTVIAKTGWEADALASAFSILSFDQSAKILRRKADIAAIIGRDNELFQSDNFSPYILSEYKTNK